MLYFIHSTALLFNFLFLFPLPFFQFTLTMKKIYFDTEFTGLEDHPPLISIGMVYQPDVTFYAELNDTWNVEQCGQFCQNEVLIHLGEQAEQSMSLVQLREQLWFWLIRMANEDSVMLLCDSPRDLEQLERIFPKGLPGHVQAKRIGFLANMKRRMFNIKNRIHLKHHLRTHHALDDALVNYFILH